MGHNSLILTISVIYLLWLVFPCWKIWYPLYYTGGLFPDNANTNWVSQLSFRPQYVLEVVLGCFCDTGDTKWAAAWILGYFHLTAMMATVRFVLSSVHNYGYVHLPSHTFFSLYYLVDPALISKGKPIPLHGHKHNMLYCRCDRVYVPGFLERTIVKCRVKGMNCTTSSVLWSMPAETAGGGGALIFMVLTFWNSRSIMVNFLTHCETKT